MKPWNVRNYTTTPDIVDVATFQFDGVSEDSIQYEAFSSEMDLIVHPDTKKLVVAASGGVDSTVLTLLAHQYCQQNDIELFTVTVDHSIREESSKEALIVKDWMEAKGINHTVLQLPWEQDRSTAVMETARQMRYDILTKYCKEIGATGLLTAHHKNDNIETFFIRVTGGSGSDGLASIPIRRLHNGIYLYRPLLSFSKDEIIATSLKMQHPWIEDPSNQNPKYQRSRVRQALKDIKDQYGLTDNNFVSFIDYFVECRLSFNQLVYMFCDRYVGFSSKFGYLSFQFDTLMSMGTTIACRILMRCFKMLTGTEMNRINPVLSIIEKMKYQDCKSTLSGCIVMKDGPMLYISLEPVSESNNTAITINLHDDIVYRNCWRIQYLRGMKHSGPLLVRQVRDSDLSDIKKTQSERYRRIRQEHPGHILNTLPVVVSPDGKVVHYPSIGPHFGIRVVCELVYINEPEYKIFTE